MQDQRETTPERTDNRSLITRGMERMGIAARQPDAGKESIDVRSAEPDEQGIEVRGVETEPIEETTARPAPETIDEATVGPVPPSAGDVTTSAAPEPARELPDAPETAAQREPDEEPANPPADASDGPLFSETQRDGFSARWREIQTSFVDDPTETVKKADSLVEDVTDAVTRSFESQRTTLEQKWNQGKAPSTEDLRLALQRYRAFFERLLQI